jgi:hypothetical protein
MHAPPKSLVIIWIVVAAELAMDLVTTIISFIALVGDSNCCDEAISLGPVALSVTIPFFLLILAELSFLTRAVKLTLFPKKREEFEEIDTTPLYKKWFFGCFKWNAKVLFAVINWLVLVNPFFGAVVAFMLLYQSSKNECFAVLGLEAASLLLHFFSVYLEGEDQTCLTILFHCVPVLPFFISVIVILVYLNLGGVCYLVDTSKFWYEGCLVCEDGSLPSENNACINNITEVPAFGTYCAEEGSFCFFGYD